MQRTGNPKFGTVLVVPSVPLVENMKSARKDPQVLLTSEQREIVEVSVRETCKFRGYELRAVHIRTNHGHAVVSGQTKPEKILNELKAYSTRNLRVSGSVESDQKVWSRGGRGTSGSPLM
ncbi:MAG: transposase [Acidobacteria bacterium]|nr:transposase [Acidobacteriota bacterium]